MHAAQRAACTQPCARSLRASGRCPSCHTSLQELLVYAVKACRGCCHRFHMHLLSHMLWGFLLQLMRANSRQLLSLCWSSLTKSLCSSPGTPQAEPLGGSPPLQCPLCRGQQLVRAAEVGAAKPSQAITHNRHRACWAQGAQRSPPTRIGWVHAAQRAACTQPCARPLRSSGRCPSRHTSPQELLVHAVEACRSCCCEFHVHLDCPTCFGASCYS